MMASTMEVVVIFFVKLFAFYGFFTAIFFDYFGYLGVFTQQGRESIVRFATLRYW